MSGNSLLKLPLVLFQRIQQLVIAPLRLSLTEALTLDRQLHNEDHASFLALRATCQTCRTRSEAIVFRHLKLQGYTANETERRLVDRLLDTNDQLAAYIRILEILPTFDADLERFSNILEQLETPLEVIWNTHLDMPASLLSALHARPEVQLYVINTARQDRPLQHALLSSPSLRGLDFTIYGDLFLEAQPSEFYVFKQLLMRKQSLKSLTLHISSYATEKLPPPPDAKAGELNLQFEAGDKFPALEKLVLECYNRYYLSAAHCDMWTKCMDWGCLRALDVGHATPQYFIRAITGHVPQLEALRFGFWPNPYGPKATWNSPPDLEVVKTFVESINALQSVIFFSWKDAECAHIRPQLLAKHGQSLKVLKHELDFRDAWKLEHFEELCDKARVLEELEVTIAMERVSEEPNPISRWPARVQRVVSSISSLRRLTLRIHLQYDSQDFTPNLPGRCIINDSFARRTVVSLFSDFAAGVIETVRVLFWAMSPGQVLWIYTAQSKWDIQKQQYEVVVDRSVEGETLDRQGRSAPFDPFG